FMLHRHQFDHRAAAQRIAIPDHHGRRLLAVAGDDLHAEIPAIPFRLLLHVKACDGGMIEGGERHSCQLSVVSCQSRRSQVRTSLLPATSLATDNWQLTTSHFGFVPSAAASARAGGESSPITSSHRPYLTACWASKKRSRSLSSRIRSNVWPVH